ncbi:MAG: hypothetical protein U0869_23460 [Chloroflexota bacterium]
MVLAAETATPGLMINAWWIVVSVLNFAIGIAVIAGIVLLVRWLLVTRPRAAREKAELRQRVARLEAALFADPAGGVGHDAGPDDAAPPSASSEA